MKNLAPLIHPAVENGKKLVLVEELVKHPVVVGEDVPNTQLLQASGSLLNHLAILVHIIRVGTNQVRNFVKNFFLFFALKWPFFFLERSEIVNFAKFVRQRRQNDIGIARFVSRRRLGKHRHVGFVLVRL